MARPKSLGAYAPLSTSYYRDDAILEAGERAELLYVRGLAYCAESPTDGYISERQLSVVVGIGMKDAPKRASVLVNVGLWEKVEGGYVIRSWLKWNKSADEIGRHLKKDRERKASVKPDGIQADSARNPDGIQTDSSDQYTSVHSTSVHDTSLDASGGTLMLIQEALIDEPEPPPTFADFRAVYPRTDDIKKAEKPWERIAKSGVDMRTVIAGAIRHRDDPNRDPSFTKLASTWLNAEAWNNGPLPKRGGTLTHLRPAQGNDAHWSQPDADFGMPDTERRSS